MTSETRARLVLPKKLKHTAPMYEDGQWFESKDDEERFGFDGDFMSALIATCIDERECPTPAEWASFSIVGGIIAALSGKYLVAPESEHALWHKSPERLLFEVLWENVEEHDGEVLDRMSMASILRSFLPRSHHSPPSRPSFASNFEQRWKGLFAGGWTDTNMQSVGNLRISRLKQGREALLTLPEPVQGSIKKVSEHAPLMLEIANECIRKAYLW